MFGLIARNVVGGVKTEPSGCEAAPPPFGFPVIDFGRCTACGVCAAACPTSALRTEKIGGTQAVSLTYAACVQCRACVSACGEQAVSAGRQTEVAAYSRAQLEVTALFDAERDGHHVFRAMETAPGPSPEEAAARLRDRVQGRLGRSLHVRQVDAGSCSGCELEIAATANPVYDFERFGIHLVASPRHADVLLVTGPVTRNMELALRRTYEAAPEPRVVVAVGACGCSGGIFGEQTHAVVGRVDRVLPVDIYIPGCPPPPHAILGGLLAAMGLREARLRPAPAVPA